MLETLSPQLPDGFETYGVTGVALSLHSASCRFLATKSSCWSGSFMMRIVMVLASLLILTQ